jgi:hypothetical protein
MKKLIILLMAGLMIMPACQNSSKESSDQIALQIKLLSQSLKENADRTVLQTELLSQSVSELSSSVHSLQQKQNAPDNKKLPVLSICPKEFPFAVAIPSEFLSMLVDTFSPYFVRFYNICKDFIKGVKK